MQFVRVSPAMTEMCVQLKWNWMIGVCALGRPGAHPRGPLAQARLVDEDDQPTLALGFFLSPGQVVRFQVCTACSSRSMARRSGFCTENPRAAEDAPDLGLAELDAVLALDESAHALERPQLGAEAMVGGFVHEHAAQCLQLLLVQPCRTPSRGHGPQRIDAAFIEHGFPRVRGLPRHTHRVCSLCAASCPPTAFAPRANAAVPLRPIASSPCLTPSACQVSV